MKPEVRPSYSEFFSDFPEILKSRNRDLRTSHDTFRGFRVHFYARNSCIAFKNSFIIFA